MIDCARPGRKKPSVLLASASTHLRLRFPFVSPPLRHSTPLAPPEAIPSSSLPPPRHTRLYCLLPRRILITFAAAIVSISRRIALSSHLRKRYYVAHARAALRSLRSMPCARGRSPAVHPPLLSFFLFFLSQISHPHRLISPASSDRFHFLAK